MKKNCLKRFYNIGESDFVTAAWKKYPLFEFLGLFLNIINFTAFPNLSVTNKIKIDLPFLKSISSFDCNGHVNAVVITTFAGCATDVSLL